ncbi:MAG: nucleotide sugar dehydrogenase [bacterium]
MNIGTLLREKIAHRSARVAVLGLGYVGLPLAFECARAGFKTVGIDLDHRKVDAINAGKNYNHDLDDRALSELVKREMLWASADFSLLQDADVIVISIHIPVDAEGRPDFSPLDLALREIRGRLKRGQLVIFESTTPPGTTEEKVKPFLEESGLKAGLDFHLAYSPERIDPGNKEFQLKNATKLVSGITPECTEAAKCFFETIIEKVVTASSPRVAEMSKLYENTFRAVNIAFANEAARMCDRLGIDVWEVIDTAATKPFGFMPFYPGPGVGGHCIPVIPHFLRWKLKSAGFDERLLALCDEINLDMPRFVTEKIERALALRERPLSQSRVLILGVAFKKDVDNYRHSPALTVMRLLREKGAEPAYHDPFVPKISWEGTELSSVKLENGIEAYDCVAVMTNHSCFNMEEIVRRSRLIVDARHATRGLKGYEEKIVKL